MDTDNNVNDKPLITHKSRLMLTAISLFAIFGTILLIGIIPRIYQRQNVVSETKSQKLTVYTLKPSFSRKTPSLDLPGEVKPFLVTSIYSRVSGTLKARYVDIGSKVHAGQLLAYVEVPEQDRELDQAKALLLQTQENAKQAKYNYEYAAKSYQRWKNTGKGGALSEQDIEQHENIFNTAYASFQATLAAVKNSQENVNRLLALQSYKRIVAPFSGIISQKNVDPGANIVAGGSPTSTNLFTIQQINELRIFINVPQTFVPCIKTGMPATITIQEYPGKVFKGKILSFSSMLDPNSRTMLTQIILPNPNNSIYPGLYTNVSLNMDKKAPAMTIPDNTILSTNDGLQVITVKPDKRLHYIKIKAGRDYGTEIEVQSGLTGNELLVTNPSDAMKENQPVKTAPGKVENLN